MYSLTTPTPCYLLVKSALCSSAPAIEDIFNSRRIDFMHHRRPILFLSLLHFYVPRTYARPFTCPALDLVYHSS